MSVDGFAPMIGERDIMSMNTHTKENGAFKIIGDTVDRIFKHGKLIDIVESHNIVVNSMLVLTATLLKGLNGYSGITYWAIGSGNASWDSDMPDPVVTEVKLTNEIGRVAIPTSEIVFLDGNGDEILTPSNVIQITHTFGANDCNGSWREFGLFGGNATSTTDSGLMIDKKHHAVITKTEDMSIERKLRLTFQYL